MLQKNNLKQLVLEFGRYLAVGASAYLIDYAVLYCAKTYVLDGIGDMGVYIAAALGFIAGLIFNYVLSLKFVFKSAKNEGKGKTFGAFTVFAVIGIVGLAITEAGMYAGCELLSIHYLIVKLFVSGIVLIWNYAARKLLIFN